MQPGFPFYDNVALADIRQILEEGKAFELGKTAWSKRNIYNTDLDQRAIDGTSTVFDATLVAPSSMVTRTSSY